MSTINFPPPLNNSQPVSTFNPLSKPEAKEPPISSSSVLNKWDTVSFSQEAKKLFADKTKNDTEVIQGLIDKAMDLLRGNVTPAKDKEKISELDAFNKKLGESKERLDDLLGKMRDTILSGDRRGTALIEKEIAKLFKG
jgi:hypothetical protein